jgi:NAD(P)-dependent dehydrogenase (short-subunit alcohol dehydrogenase family)
MKVIIITGANNGIGLALTKSLLDLGERVAAFDLSGENLDLVNPNLRYLPCDVTDPQRIKQAVAEVMETWCHVDVLVNNACIALFKPFINRSVDEIRQEFEVNYYGYLNTINAVLPIMLKQGQGVIHNFSSGVGYTGYPGLTGYTSTKGAIESFTHTLALELEGSGVTVNIIQPSLTRTKSSLPLAIPPEFMASAEDVGRKLAGKIGSKNPVVTPDFGTALGTFANQHFPLGMGRFLSSRAKMVAEKAKTGN